MWTGMVIQPQGKRKHKIIFNAIFNEAYKVWWELDKILSMQLWKMGVFDI